LLRSARLCLPLAVAVAAFAPAVASAADGPVSHAQALAALHDARQALSPVEPLAAGATLGSRDATAPLRDLAIATPSLNRAGRRQANSLLARPADKTDRNYFGKEDPNSPICDEHFCIHFTTQKRNAPTSQDFISEVVASTDLTYSIENGDDALDWRDPKSDGTRGERHGVGGEGQTDVYITDLGPQLYGYAAPDPGQKGPKRYAYLVLDNDYVNFPSPPIASLRVTVAHEYNHILQFNYDNEEDLWMFEATATWAEQQVYPNINDYLNYLPTFARFAQAPLTSRVKVYADSVWNHWLSARYGVDVVRDAWAASLGAKPPHFAVAAYEKAIENHGGKSFSREFTAFAETTAEWNSSDSFPDAKVYPDMKRRGQLGAKNTKVTLDDTAFQLTDVPAKGSKPVKLTVDAPRGIRSAVALVARTGPIDGGTVKTVSRYLSKGGSGTVTLDNPGSYDRVTAVVINADGRLAGKNYRSDGSVYSVKLGD
jgi:hypothetical protein